LSSELKLASIGRLRVNMTRMHMHQISSINEPLKYGERENDWKWMKWLAWNKG